MSSNSKLLRIAVFAGLLLGTSSVFAEGSTQTHHCKMPDGTMDMNKKKKECKASKGAWTKDALTTTPTPVKPAPSPAPSK
jgi:hypothetical protein